MVLQPTHEIKKKMLTELDLSGTMSLFIREGMCIEMKIKHLSKLFQEYIGDICAPFPLILTENVMSDDYERVTEMLVYLAIS